MEYTWADELLTAIAKLNQGTEGELNLSLLIVKFVTNSNENVSDKDNW